MTEWLERIGQQAKTASKALGCLGTEDKNRGLRMAAEALLEGAEEILKANKEDVAAAREKGMKPGLIDRLMLSESRIQAMAEGLLQVAALEDPIGEFLSMKPRPNGLLIGQKRVPLGVVGIIYEARPNVTADAFGLCFKAGNAVILKGGSDALKSNMAVVRRLRCGLERAGIPGTAVQLIESTDRESTRAFMSMNRYLDVLIPRGGAGLIRTVVENSTVPVIETGTGNCHVFVDQSADLKMALDIIENAKTQRVGVCNACESLVVHEKAAGEFLPRLKEVLDRHHVEVRADERARALVPEFGTATEEDWGTEYLDYILSRSWTHWKRPSATSTSTIQVIRRRLSPRIMIMPSGFLMRLTRRQCMSMPPPGLRTGLSSALGPRSGSAPRSFTPEGLWGFWR